MAYWDEVEQKWVEKFTRTAALKRRDDTVVEENNTNQIQLVGQLQQYTRFSSKVGSCKIKVSDFSHGKRHENRFYVAVFESLLDCVDNIPLGSKVRVTGRLKNNVVERDGVTNTKIEIVANQIEKMEDAPTW